ncbi:hypothetical protein KNE206_65110 [Kitasatospora sp. NE20-6]|uniref:SMI1/KNR4 family protein n=1 Tax=Kitasatospora sp. NE20-6 TaxID=2859066 RepID=UPI0034DC2EFD
MNEHTWAGVRERVLALAAAPDTVDVFGRSGHRFALEAPLTAEELADLESSAGVTLPEDYRAFLLQVGAGGAGPAYGLFPVRRVQGRWRWEGDGADLADLARLAEPFPPLGPDPEEVEALLTERPEEEDFEDIEVFDTATEAWDERWDALMWAGDRTAGAVVICHLGCAYREWLVVSGPERGRMWADSRVDDIDLAPLLDERGAAVTFTRWYLGWLEQAEQAVAAAATTATATATAAAAAR